MYGKNLWLQHSNSGGGIRFYTDNNDINARLTISYASSYTPEDDVYEQDGMKAGIAYHDESVTAAALTAGQKTVGNSSGLAAQDMLMRPDVLDNEGVLLVAEDSDIAEWTFRSAGADKYYITLNVDNTEKYLTINKGNVTLETEPDEQFSVITAVPGTGTNSGKWHFSVNGYSLNFTYSARRSYAACLKEESAIIINSSSRDMYKKESNNRIDDLSLYDGKYVCIRDINGETFSGLARYGNYEFLECEWGSEEDGIFIEDFLIYNSQIEFIEEIVPTGTAELWTEHLILRRYRMDDVEQLYKYFGTDPDMYKYSGWNPYATPEMAKETVQQFIESYGDDHSYSWVMDAYGDDVVAGTIGAYDYNCDQIEVGFSVHKSWQGRGFATEALRKVLEYLTESEGIPCVTAWCAADNIGSRRVLEKTGMKLVKTVKDGLNVGDKVYDKLIYEYRNR